MSMATQRKASVLHVVVVGFHHQKGCQIEYSRPEIESDKIATIWRFLPYLAIPDGAHKTKEGCVFFTIPLEGSQLHGDQRIYGISCYKQIDSNKVAVKDQESTRSTILKAVLVLLDKPCFGLIQAKLSAVTKVYFDIGDFSQRDIINEFYESLNLSLDEPLQVYQYYIGLNLSHLIRIFQHKILVIFKLLLLEQKVLFYGFPTDEVCYSLLSFLSLFPGLIDKGLCNLCTDTPDEFGLPLPLFSKECIVEPYFALQQLDSLRASNVTSYVAGATNPLLRQRTDWINAIVDIEEDGTGELTLMTPELTSLLSLSTADIQFVDYLLANVHSESSQIDTKWEGSDDWIRAQFKLYLLSLLCSSLCQGSSLWRDFNFDFVSALRLTQHYCVWKEKGQPGMTEVDPQHPFHGDSSSAEISHRVAKFMGLSGRQEDQLSKVVAGATKVMSTAGTQVKETMGSFWSSAKAWFTAEEEEKEGEKQNNDT